MVFDYLWRTLITLDLLGSAAGYFFYFCYFDSLEVLNSFFDYFESFDSFDSFESFGYSFLRLSPV